MDGRERCVGIVGHRVFASKATAEFVAEACAAVLRTCMTRFHLTALSALAEGADTTFAETALELGLPLSIVRPFARYGDDFEAPPARRTYERLRAAAREETTLPFAVRSTAAYMAAMSWIVRRSDLLVAVWDGRLSGAQGGTADAVSRVMHERRTWVHVDVTRHRVTPHLSTERVENLPWSMGAQL